MRQTKRALTLQKFFKQVKSAYGRGLKLADAAETSALIETKKVYFSADRVTEVTFNKILNNADKIQLEGKGFSIRCGYNYDSYEMDRESSTSNFLEVTAYIFDLELADPSDVASALAGANKRLNSILKGRV